MINTIKLFPAGKDFIVRQIFKNGWIRVSIILGVIYLFVSIPVILSYFAGNFINKDLDMDAYSDKSYHAMFFVLLPFFVFFIRYYLTGLEDAIDKLCNSKVLRISPMRYCRAVEYSNNLFSCRFVTFIPYFLAALLLIDSILNYNLKGLHTWNSTSLSGINIISSIDIVITYFFFYFFFALLLRMILTYFVIRKFLSGNINVQPLHPDNCGGLAPLGEFALRITWAGFFVGIPVLWLMYGNYLNNIPHYQLTNIFNLSFYVISMTVVFFLPLLGARKSMRRAKDKELRLINDIFQKGRKDVLLNINKYKVEGEVEISNLEKLIKLHDIAKSMPVWPFNSRNIVRFLSSVLWPVLLILIQYIFGKL
jgi:hypothetical protein